jgi:hypothetical protein
MFIRTVWLESGKVIVNAKYSLTYVMNNRNHILAAVIAIIPFGLKERNM